MRSGEAQKRQLFFSDVTSIHLGGVIRTPSVRVGKKVVIGLLCDEHGERVSVEVCGQVDEPSRIDFPYITAITKPQIKTLFENRYPADGVF